MSDIALVVILVVVLLLISLVVPQLLVRRAIPSVIRIFRQYNAVGIKNAKAIDELGLAPKGMFGGSIRRDYKPRALDVLIRAEIVQMTEDGKVYLSEEKLMGTKLGR